jgi:hypothetical protein
VTEPDTRARALAAIAALETELRATFGWAELAIDVEVVEDRAVLRGDVVAARVQASVVECVGKAVPDLAVDDRLVLRRGATWHALADGITPLLRRTIGPRELATELFADDGPVERIADVTSATLVRAPDGTLGWIEGPLGPAVAAPVFAAVGPFDRTALARAPDRWLDVPYRLGGTTVRGVDCSGLVQRELAAIGVRVPRHSGDQFAIAPRDEEGDDDLGALVLVWASDEAPCHVGLALGDGRVVHASRSRSRVVVDARADLFARARRIAHVRWDDLVALQERARGCTSLVEVLALGRT